MIDNAQALKDRITLQNTDVDEDTKARLLNALPEFGWPLYLWNAMADKETQHSYSFVDAETDRDKVEQVVLYLKAVKEYAEKEIEEWEDLLDWVEEQEESPSKVVRWGKPKEIQGEKEYNSAPIGTIVASKYAKLPWYKVKDGWSPLPGGSALESTLELSIFYSDAREVVQWGNK